MWKRAAYYGLFLAAGTLALQWLDYQRLKRAGVKGMFRKVICYGVIAGLVVGSILFGMGLGVTGEALVKFAAEMEQFRVRYTDPLFRVPMTFVEIFPVGVLVSLLSAGWLRTRRSRA